MFRLVLAVLLLRRIRFDGLMLYKFFRFSLFILPALQDDLQRINLSRSPDSSMFSPWALGFLQELRPFGAFHRVCEGSKTGRPEGGANTWPGDIVANLVEALLPFVTSQAYIQKCVL